MKDLELATSKPCTAWYWLLNLTLVSQILVEVVLSWVDNPGQSLEMIVHSCELLEDLSGNLKSDFETKKIHISAISPQKPVRRPYPRPFTKENQLGKVLIILYQQTAQTSVFLNFRSAPLIWRIATILFWMRCEWTNSFPKKNKYPRFFFGRATF